MTKVIKLQSGGTMFVQDEQNNHDVTLGFNRPHQVTRLQTLSIPDAHALLHALQEVLQPPATPLSVAEQRHRAVGNLEGTVWALRAFGMFYADIDKIVRKASSEYDPARSPAFILDSNDER